MLVGLATQTTTQTSVDGSIHYRIKVAKTSLASQAGVQEQEDT